jgi:hypothetical protein
MHKAAGTATTRAGGSNRSRKLFREFLCGMFVSPESRHWLCPPRILIFPANSSGRVPPGTGRPLNG